VRFIRNQTDSRKTLVPRAAIFLGMAFGPTLGLGPQGCTSPADPYWNGMELLPIHVYAVTLWTCYGTL